MRDVTEKRKEEEIFMGWATHHSIDASILREGLVEAADRSQEYDVAVIEKRDPGRCYVGRTEVEVSEDRGS